MTNFQLAPGPYAYRALRAGDRGWDVFSLQTALNDWRGALTEDGVFGETTETADSKTGMAVRDYQKIHGLAVDGIAGILTQRSLALAAGVKVRKRHHLPVGLLHGLIESESGFQLGNYTAPYKNGSRDLGVVQRNSQYATRVEAFHVPAAIEYFGSHIRDRFGAFLGQDERGVSEPRKVSVRRAWELAAGSWNRPAWTAWLGGRPKAEWGPTPPDADELAWVAGYIGRTTRYCTTWPS